MTLGVRYALATTHISIVLARTIAAFIVHVNDDGGAIAYLADIGQPLNRSKDMIYVTLVSLQPVHHGVIQPLIHIR